LFLHSSEIGGAGKPGGWEAGKQGGKPLPRGEVKKVTNLKISL
jgi:hypothetical protein